MAHELFPLPAAKAGEKIASISELIGRKGDAKNGRLVFNTAGTCHKCHIVNKIGRNLGPELSEIGSKLSRQAMLESILFPSAGISHNYDTWTLVLSNGTTTTGLILSETDESLNIIDNEAFKHTVSTDEIDDRIRQSVSMMPADLQKILSSQELIDVVAYMETLKKAVP
jgi:putative heme-binding domain-containing protein